MIHALLIVDFNEEIILEENPGDFDKKEIEKIKLKLLAGASTPNSRLTDQMNLRKENY